MSQLGRKGVARMRGHVPLVPPSAIVFRGDAKQPTTAVIPGRATWREPGIHNHEIAFGARCGAIHVQH